MTSREKQSPRLSLFNKLLRLFGLVVLGLVVGISTAAYLMLHQSVAPTDGTLTFINVEQPIEITYDSLGVPQIWAQTEPDGYFALGYLHGADRLFQLDLVRRLATGRLSELLGEVTLDADIEQRRIGHRRMAERFEADLSDSVRSILRAYTDGVNAYADSCSVLPFEYWLLPGSFVKFTIADCLAILSFQCWYSDALQNNDQFFLDLADRQGRDSISTLDLDYPEWVPTTVTRPEPQSGLLTPWQLAQSQIAEQILASQFRLSLSSNAWVVGPQRSSSGRAMLASDPHLETSRLPQFWYLVGLHIESVEMDVVGISTPGLPVIIMGHNGQAAWAFTAGGVDVTDYYDERVNPDDTNQYLTPDGWSLFETWDDTIAVAGSDSPEIIRFRRTRHGPVVDDNMDGGTVRTLHWAGFDMNLADAIAAGLDLHQTCEFQSFRRVVTRFGALDANWMYADSGGTIGYQLGTPIPVRADPVDNFPKVGWTGEYDWQGYYPLLETPHTKNPRCGWLASCNNKPADDLPYSLLGNFASDRILRISQLLDSKDIFTPDDMTCFQLDQVDSSLLMWRDEVARLLAIAGEQERAEVLAEWDGVADLDSREVPLILLFQAKLKEELLQSRLGGLASSIRSAWLHQMYFGGEIAHPVDSQCQEAGLRAIKRTLASLVDKPWGEIQSLTMRHPMDRVPIVGSLLGLGHGPWPWSGTPGTLNSSFFRRKSDSVCTSIVGPNWRFVIDFADIDNAQMVLPAGNSGNPMSDHFFDFNSLWREGNSWIVPLSRAAVELRAVSRLSLMPPNVSGD